MQKYSYNAYKKKEKPCWSKIQVSDIIAEIEESDNENSLLGDDTSEGEYDNVSDSDST